ncbi:MAG: nucleoside hydrolase [Pseudomonadota bacterium]
MNLMQKIIFDTDPGIDDAMAILFAEASPEIDLLGITTILGNASIELTTRNALHIVDTFDIAAPVFRGAAAPLSMPAGDPPTFVHGDDGLGNISPPTPSREVSSMTAAEYIVDTVQRYPGEVTLVAVGRLTNLALAIAAEPRIVDAVRQVVIMGGALGGGGHHGNITAFAEANIYGDPHAADAVFSADWPVVMVGLDVTMQVMMDEARMQRIRDAADDAGDFVYRISRFYQAFYTESAGFDGFPVHDSSALAYVIDRSLFETQKGALSVVLDGERIGQTSFAETGRELASSAFGGRPQQLVCTGVNDTAVLDLYERTLIEGFG